MTSQFDDTMSQHFFVRVTFCGVQGAKVDLGRMRHEWRHKECLARDLNLFQRFDALGFHNLVVRDDAPLPGCECEAGASCRHVQTQRHNRSTFPWQTDYVFVTSDILARRPNLH